VSNKGPYSEFKKNGGFLQKAGVGEGYNGVGIYPVQAGLQ
jgi:hypothetical protein